MIIVLCGYMGSGKSLIGRKLAAQLNFSFVDLDCEITKDQNMSIPDIFLEKGEISFRKIEMKVLKECLKTTENTVLALGGGTPCYGRNLESIKNTSDAKLIYLKMSLDSLTERLLNEQGERPLLSTIDNKENLKDYIRKHLFERQFYYMQADFNLDCSTTSPETIVKEIVEKI